jgi:hypothetical protein
MTAQLIQVPDSVQNPDSNKSKQLLAKVPTGLLIGSDFVKGENEDFDVLDPANGDLLTKVSNAGVKDLAKALDIAVVAQENCTKSSR